MAVLMDPTLCLSAVWHLPILQVKEIESRHLKCFLRAFPESPPLAIHRNISCRHMNKAIFTTHLDSLQEIILRCLPFDLIPQWLQSLSHSLLHRSYSFLKENKIYCRKLFRMCSCRLNTFTELGLDLQFNIFKSLYFSSCTLSLFWDCYNWRRGGGDIHFS